jgi:3-deoxy-D-arabino-heptulosonate 7-phosphate (DAHP) synthase
MKAAFLLAAYDEDEVGGEGRTVLRLHPRLAPYKVASREVQPEPTVVRAGSLVVGGGTVGVIAGPCSVESREQIVATAAAVKALGEGAIAYYQWSRNEREAPANPASVQDGEGHRVAF